MIAAAEKFPQYGFEKNVGYGTKQHMDALREFGPCELHRRSFIKKILAERGEC
jgi:ribonuclease HII